MSIHTVSGFQSRIFLFLVIIIIIIIIGLDSWAHESSLDTDKFSFLSKVLNNKKQSAQEN
jgi:hypothetical protein